jgi:hypothetical protein
MWVAIGHSEVGTSHFASGAECQDYHEYFPTFLGSERALLIGIADGAGSALAARIGAEECVRHLLQSAARSEKKVSDLTEEVVRAWFVGARSRMESVAAREGVALREVSCTALLAVLGETSCVFAQVGDGGWVAEYRGECDWMTWPTHGEHANETIFLTHPALMTSVGWDQYFQFRRWERPVMNVAGFTDGLEALALHFAAHSVHAPFFAGMFSGLSHALPDHSDLQEFAAPLIAFLQSPDVNQRTDDDKTLVIACRRKLALCDAPSE